MICIHNILVISLRDVTSWAVEEKAVLWLNELEIHNCDWPDSIKSLSNISNSSINHDLEYTVGEVVVDKSCLNYINWECLIVVIFLVILQFSFLK